MTEAAEASLSIIHYAVYTDGRLPDLSEDVDAILRDIGRTPLGEIGLRSLAPKNALTTDRTVRLAEPPGSAFVWYRRRNADCLVWSHDAEVSPDQWADWLAEERTRAASLPKHALAIASAGFVDNADWQSPFLNAAAASMGIVVTSDSSGQRGNGVAVLRSLDGWLVATLDNSSTAVQFLLGFDVGSLPCVLLAKAFFGAEMAQVERAVQLLDEARQNLERSPWHDQARTTIQSMKPVIARAASHAGQARLSTAFSAAAAWNAEIERRLASARRQYHALAMEVGMRLNDIDFVIITALDEERDAVLAKFNNYRQLDKDGIDTHTYFEATVQTRRADGAHYRIIITSLVGMGPLMANSKAQAVVTRWHPKQVLLVGIACGLPAESSHGDVLIARQVADYTLGKIRPDGTREVRWQSYQAGANLLDAAVNLSTDWIDLITVRRPQPDSRPERRCDTIASGGNVISNDEIQATYQRQWPKLIGIEMEAAGIAAGLHNTINPPEFLMIKAVSDFGKDKHDPAVKPWRPYACDVAASFAFGLIRSGTGPAVA